VYPGVEQRRIERARSSWAGSSALNLLGGARWLRPHEENALSLSRKQHGVLRGMAGGAAIAGAIIIFGIGLNPFGFSPQLSLEGRVSVAIQSSSLLAICLAVAIGRLARHRFFTPEDIDGGGLRPGSNRAILLQSLLQNTLEQSVLALLTYVAWAAAMPADWLSVVPLAAVSFMLGRLLFFAGYGSGAPSRALGFTMAFYPSLAMLLCIAVAEALSFAGLASP